MGATTSVERNAMSAEDASSEDHSAVENSTQEGSNIDAKPLQKNGQISIPSLDGKTDNQTELNGHSADKNLAEVGQTDAMSQREDSPDTVEVLQDEVLPKVNGEKGENESANADEITATEEKVAEEKTVESNEVGFKKIFRFVGFKFTVKKDKNEKTEPVQLLTMKEADDGASESAVGESKDDVATNESKPAEDKEEDAEKKKALCSEATVETVATVLPNDDAGAEPTSNGESKGQIAPEASEQMTVEQSQEDPKESQASATETPDETSSGSNAQEIQSPFKRFFTQGIFSNLRKKASVKKPKEEEQTKEVLTEEEIKEKEESSEAVGKEGEKATEEMKIEATEKPENHEESKAKPTPEDVPVTTVEQKDDVIKEHIKHVTPTEEIMKPPDTESKDDTKPTDEGETIEEKPEESVEEQPSPEKTPEEITTETDILSSQEKVKAQSSPLKKLLTGAGLKKLSTKKQKGKKETEPKIIDSNEQVTEQTPSTDVAEDQKPDSGPSSPEESNEYAAVKAPQTESGLEGEEEAVTSDSEKKKDGILQWSSFKKLVTPKKRVKRSSESEDEAAPSEKPKSATLSSTESAVFEEKPEEPKPSEDTEAETAAEKVEPTAEEPKKKMDTSVSWEALICVGSAKKRARKTSDSDDEETKIEEEIQVSGEEQMKTAESPLSSSHEADNENVASSSEPEGELVSTWESFKRLVTQRRKPKPDDGSGTEQAMSDSEIPKEESSFSIKKLIPRRKKKSDGKQEQVPSDVGSAEEDSDTPAVVPLSEYDNEPAVEEAVQETMNTEEVKQEITLPVTQVKASAEERSPSWISTTVEDLPNETEGKQLSDIPEEGDTAVTPKSADNTIAEDIVDLTSEAVTALEPAEETEMVSALSRISATPVTSGETTPVPGDSAKEHKVDVVLQEAVENISITPCATAVEITEDQQKAPMVSTSTMQVESTTKEEKVVLTVHTKNEATTICTGLVTEEIVYLNEKAMETSTSANVAVVSDIQQQVEIPEELVDTQNSQKVETEGPVEPTIENYICSQTVEVSEVTVTKGEKVQELEDVQQSIVNTELAPVDEYGITLTEEMTVALSAIPVEVMSESKEPPIPIEASTEEPIVFQESTAVINALSETTESKTVDFKDLAVLERVPHIEYANAHHIKVLGDSINIAAAQTAIESSVEAATSDIYPVVEVCEKVKEDEMLQAKQEMEAEIIQEQSSVIIQNVVQLQVQKEQETSEMKDEEKGSSSIEAEAPKPDEQAKTETTSEEVAAEETSAQEEESPADTASEQSVSTESADKGKEETTQLVTEKPLQIVNEAIQVTETVPTAITDRIEPVQREAAVISIVTEQESMEVAKDTVELKHKEEAVIVSKVSKEETVSTDSIKQVHIIEGHCQTADEIHIETAMEFSVGVINVVSADDKPSQDVTNEIVLECHSSEGEEPVVDSLEEPQKETSTQDTRRTEGAIDATCQITDSKDKATKMETAVEETAVSLQEVVEEIESVIEPVSTDIATVS